MTTEQPWARHRTTELLDEIHPGEMKVASQQGKDLSELTLAELQSFNPVIEADVFDALSLEGSLNARNTLGGTAPAQVRLQLARHRARLA